MVGMPFGLAILSYELGMAMPGTINRAGWEISVSIAFIGSVIPVTMLLARARLNRMVRVVLGIVVVPILLLSALGTQVHSTCGPTQTYIGQTDPTWNDSECGD